MQTAKNRAEKLRNILNKLENGENIQNRMLKTWLTENEYKEFLNSWEEQIEIRNELKDKPHEIKEYEEQLKKALFIYNKAENYSHLNNHSTAKKLYTEAEVAFEYLMEYLQGIITADQNLRIWFDRNTDWDIDSIAAADIDNIPRVVTSRSNQRISPSPLVLSKNTIKQQIVSKALNNLNNQFNDKEVNQKLNKLLKNIKQ